MSAPGDLEGLVYELLDAHDDTARLANDPWADELRWAAHLDYLRALQRVTRERLAHATRGHDAPRSGPGRLSLH